MTPCLCAQQADDRPGCTLDERRGACAHWNGEKCLRVVLARQEPGNAAARLREAEEAERRRLRDAEVAEAVERSRAEAGPRWPVGVLPWGEDAARVDEELGVEGDA
jgi:hypothetical protein